MFDDVMSAAAIWIFLAFVVERLVEWLSKMIPWLAGASIGKLKVQTVLAFAISLLFSFGARLDFFAMFHIPFTVPAVGPVIAAIFMSGGSNLVHDIVSWVTNKKEESKSRAAVRAAEAEITLRKIA